MFDGWLGIWLTATLFSYLWALPVKRKKSAESPPHTPAVKMARNNSTHSLKPSTIFFSPQLSALWSLPSVYKAIERRVCSQSSNPAMESTSSLTRAKGQKRMTASWSGLRRALP